MSVWRSPPGSGSSADQVASAPGKRGAPRPLSEDRRKREVRDAEVAERLREDRAGGDRITRAVVNTECFALHILAEIERARTRLTNVTSAPLENAGEIRRPRRSGLQVLDVLQLRERRQRERGSASVFNFEEVPLLVADERFERVETAERRQRDFRVAQFGQAPPDQQLEPAEQRDAVGAPDREGPQSRRVVHVRVLEHADRVALCGQSHLAWGGSAATARLASCLAPARLARAGLRAVTTAKFGCKET